MASDFVNPEANVIEDKDVKDFTSKQSAPAPKFDFQSAQPLKTIPQLATNRSARYQRPLTDAERGEATADYFTGKPGAMERERRAVDTPEVQTGISTLLGGGQEAFGGWTPTAVSAMRGIEANREHPKPSYDAFKDMMNSLHDNAVRGIFEPETTEPTSVHILNNPELFGKTNYQTAAAVGTLAEFFASMVINPLAIIPEWFQALSRERQNTLLYNKITQSSHWGDNIMAMAGKSGVPWQKVLPEAYRRLWGAINEGNYLQVVMKNLDLYKPFKLEGLTTEDVQGPMPSEAPIPGEPKPGAFSLKPTVNVPGMSPSYGINHNEALKKIGMIKAEFAASSKKQSAGEKKVSKPTTIGGLIKQHGNMDFTKADWLSEEDKKGKYLYHRSGAQGPDELAQELVSQHLLPEGTTGEQLFKMNWSEKLPDQGKDYDKEYDLWSQNQPIEGFEPVEEGKDFQAGFTDPEGKFYTRDEAQSKFGVGESEDIPMEHRVRAVHSHDVAPYEVDDTAAPRNLVSMRQKHLEGQGSTLHTQINDLYTQKNLAVEKQQDTSKIDISLKKLIKKWEQIQDKLSENIAGQVTINDIKNKVGQVRINAVLNAEDKGFSEGFNLGRRAGEKKGSQNEREFQKAVQEYRDIANKIRTGEKVSDAEREKYLSGFSKGFIEGRGKGAIEERRRKASIVLYAKYLQNARDEAYKIAATLQRIKDSTEGLPIEYKNLLDAMLDKFDLNNRTGKTLTRRERLKEFLDKSKSNGDEIKVPEEDIKAASQIPLNDLTVLELREIHDLVNRIYRMGRLKNKLLDLKGLRDLNAVAREAIDNITGGKGLSMINKFHDDLDKNDPGFFKAVEAAAKKVGRSPKEYLISNLLPEVQILFLDNLDNGGILYQKMFTPLHEATNTAMDNIDKANRDTNAIFTRKPKEYNQLLQIGDKKIRLEDAMWIYANSVNDVQRAHMQSYGVTDKDIKNVEESLHEDDKMAVRKLWQYYSERFKTLSDLRYELEGVVTKQEDNYFPISNLDDVSPEEDLLWENTLRSDYRKGAIDKGMLKTRTGGKKAFKKMDFFGTIGKNIDKVEHYIAFAKAIRNANRIINHSGIKSAIRNHKDFGEFYYNSLRKWISDTARGRFLYETDWFSRLGRGTRMNFTSAFLGLNPSPALKQWTGLFYGAEMAGKSATLKSIPKLLFNYRKLSAQIDTESSMMRHASLRQQRELEELFSERGFFERTGELTGWHKFQAGMMFLTQQSDLIIRRAVYLGTQEALKARGVEDKNQLVQEAERVVRRTQPMGGITYLPDIFRGGEGARQITFLRGHVNKLWNVQAEMIAKMANGKMRMAQVFSQILMNNVLPMLWLAAVTGTGIFAVKKAKEQGGLWGMEAAQLVTGIPLVEDAVNSLRSGHNELNLPMIEYAQMAWDAITSKNTRKHPNKKLQKAAEFAGAATGLPVIGAEKLTGWGKADEDNYRRTMGNNQDDIYK